MRSSAETVPLVVVLGLIMSIGMFGNLMVIIAVLLVRSLRRTLSNYLIMNLAIADLLASSFLMPFQFAALIDIELISNNGWFCKIGGMLSYPFYIASTMTLVALSVDRHIALHQALRYKELVTPRVIFFMVLCTWCYAFLFTLILGLVASVGFDPHGLDCGVSWDESPLWLNWAAVILNVALPFLLLTIMNLRVLLIARTQQKRICAESVISGQPNPARGREIKTALTVLVIIFVFLICWTPFIVTRALITFGVVISRVVSMVVVWILHASNAVNFFIYALRRSDYRMAFKSVLRCGKGDNIITGTSAARGLNELPNVNANVNVSRTKVY